MTSPLKEEEDKEDGEDKVPEESSKPSLSRKSSKFAVTSVDERSDGDGEGDGRKSRTASKFEVTSIEDPHDGDGEPSLSRTPSKVSKFSVSRVDVSSDQPQSRQGSVTTLALEGEERDTEDGDRVPEGENSKTVKHIKELETQQSVEDILELETMEDIVKRLLAGRNIRDLHIVSSADSKQTQISFCVGLDQVEDLLLELQRNGIGQAEQVLQPYIYTFTKYYYTVHDQRAAGQPPRGPEQEAAGGGGDGGDGRQDLSPRGQDGEVLLDHQVSAAGVRGDGEDRGRLRVLLRLPAAARADRGHLLLRAAGELERDAGGLHAG